MSTASFTTRAGSPAGTVAYVAPVAGATYTVEFSRNSSFRTILITKPVILNDNAVTISMTAAEVDQLGDGYYRVRATKDDRVWTLVDGSIDYIPKAKTTGLTVADVVSDPVFIDAIPTAAELAASPELRAAFAPRGLRNLPGMYPLGARAGIGQGFIGTISGQDNRYRVTVPFQTNEVRLVYTNWIGPGTAERDGTADLVVRAGIEMPDGSFRAVYFAGQRDVRIGIGGSAVSDPVAVEHAGPTDPSPFLYVRTKVTAYTAGTSTLAPGSIPQGPLMTATGEGTDSDPAGDVTTSGTVGSTYNFMYVPAVVAGNCTDAAPIIALIGDSITLGKNDGPDNYGWGARAAEAARLPYLKLAEGGVQAQYVSVPNGHARTFALGTGATDALVMLGTNDLGTATVSGGVITAVQIYLYRIWLAWSRRGARVRACTLVPRATSTDSWATLGNQTPMASNPARIIINDWIRAGAPLDAATKAPAAVGAPGSIVAGQTGHPLVGYIDTADAVESARNSGLWIVNGSANYATSDGTHPGGTAYGLIAAKVPTAAFTA